MKKIENNFTVSGFVGKDAEIRQFANASVARFSLAVGRQEKNGEETNRVSLFPNILKEDLVKLTKAVDYLLDNRKA
jgi:single-strand DNA-binding protein